MEKEFDIIRIRNQLTGQCLQILDSANPIINTIACGGLSRDQEWMWINMVDGSRSLQSLSNTQCMAHVDRNGVCDTIRTNICDIGNSTQHWLMRGDLLVNADCGACVTTSFSSNAYLAQCGGNNFQYWDVLPVLSGLANETDLVNETL